MTNAELTKIFQEVNCDLVEEHILEKIAEKFKSYCNPDANGRASTDSIAPAIMHAMIDYNHDFLFRVLSKALCKD